MTPTELIAIRAAELALRIIPPLLRVARRHADATDVEARRAELRREIERQRGERSKARILTR